MFAGGDGGILVTVAFGWLIVLGMRLVVPALLPRISREFDLGHTIGGSLFTLLLVIAALMQFPGGILADRTGGRTVLFLGVTITGIGVVLITVSPLFGAFIVGIALFGVGTGLYGTPRVTVLSTIFPDHDGTAIGITSAAGNVGTAALPVVATAIAVSLGWRTGFAFAVPLFAVTAAAIWWTVPSTRPVEDGRSFRADGRLVLDSLRDATVLRATAVMMIVFFVYQGLTAFLPTYYVETKGLDESLAATLYGGFFAGGVLAQIGLGNLGDRYRSDRILPLLVGVSAVFVLLLPYTGGVVPLAILSVLLSVQLGFWPIAFSYTIGALPGEIRSSGLGLLRTVYLLVGSLGSVAVGVLADVGYFDGAFLFLGGCTAAAALLCLGLPPLGGRPDS